MPTINTIVVTIGATELHEAQRFYEALGFKADWLWPEEKPTHLSLSYGAVSFMVSRQMAEDIQKADLYFRVEGVQDLHDIFKKLNLDISPLTQSTYGMLDFSFCDPWGHLLTFGEPHGEFSM